jgi:hypothetical protein
VDGLRLNADDVQVLGLAIHSFGNATDARSGVQVLGGVGARVQDCFIGLDADGTTNRGNSRHGVSLEGGINHLIGGSGANPGASGANRIAYNGQSGVQVLSGVGHTVRGNSIFLNGGLGINLAFNAEAPNTPTLNDAGDADSGLNNGQNFPDITSATRSGSTQVLAGTLSTNASREYDIDLYRNINADPSGFGEGQVYVATQRVTTGADGRAPFEFTVAGSQLFGQSFSATATAVATGETSEFGASKATIAAALSLAITPAIISENGGRATGTITRNTSTSGPLTVALSSSAPDEATVPTSVEIPARQASATFVITGVDDRAREGAQNVIITATAAGLAPATGVVGVSDDDTPSLAVSPLAGLVVNEDGATSTFAVALGSQPSANVSISITSSDTGEGTVSPATLLFTPTNFDTPQTVTVRGVDDNAVDGDRAFSIAVVAQSADADYDSLRTTVQAVNRDNDRSALAIALASTLAEGETATTTITRTGPTTGALTIALESSNEGALSVPAQVTIAAGEASATFTVTARDNSVASGAVSVDITARATGFVDVSRTVSIADDDVVGIAVAPTTGLQTTEAGGTSTFTVRLTSQPDSAVTIALSSSDTGEGTVSPASLTFTPQDFATPQTVTVRGVDDDVDDGDVAYTIVTCPGREHGSIVCRRRRARCRRGERGQRQSHAFAFDPAGHLLRRRRRAGRDRNRHAQLQHLAVAHGHAGFERRGRGEGSRERDHHAGPAHGQLLRGRSRRRSERRREGRDHLGSRAGFTGDTRSVTVLDNDGPPFRSRLRRARSAKTAARGRLWARSRATQILWNRSQSRCAQPIRARPACRPA